MSNSLVKKENTNIAKNIVTSEQFLSIRVADHIFGIPVIKIVDVLKPVNLTPIPLAKREISGLMNLRGRIVTVIDLRKRLKLESETLAKKPMFVVVEYEQEIFSLMIDEVGQALTLPVADFGKIPENLPAHLHEICHGIFQLEKELMLVLNIKSLVNF